MKKTEVRKRVTAFSVISDADKLIKENEYLVSNFLYKFISCEVACKQIIECIDGIEQKETKLNVNVIKKCVKSYGIIFDDNMLYEIFSAEDSKGHRSCKKLRDNVVHGLKKSAIEEIKNRYDELFRAMNMFIKQLK